MIRNILAAAVFAALASTRLAAQIAPESVGGIAPGTRIRVSATAARDREASRNGNSRAWQTGVLQAVTDDGLVLVTDASHPDARVTIPLEVIQDVEVSRGNKSAAGMRKGALVGGAGGMLAGLVFNGVVRLATDCHDDGGCELLTDHNHSGTGNLVRDVGIGVVGGMVVGALVGSRAREVWEPAARHVSVAPAGMGGTGLGLSFRF